MAMHLVLFLLRAQETMEEVSPRYFSPLSNPETQGAFRASVRWDPVRRLIVFCTSEDEGDIEFEPPDLSDPEFVQVAWGVYRVLEYARSESKVDAEITLFDLRSYNTLSRHLDKWSRQFWHTSRDKKVPRPELFKKLHSLLATPGCKVKFKYCPRPPNRFTSHQRTRVGEMLSG